MSYGTESEANVNHWKIEAAFALGRAGLTSNAWPLIVKAANAAQRANEADCSVCPEAWQKELTKRAEAAMKRLGSFLHENYNNGHPFGIIEQGDPRGCPFTLAGLSIPGDGFPASWYARAERAAYAERDAQKAGAK